MMHSLVPTLAIVMLGILVARAGDLLRFPILGRQSGSEAQSYAVVWQYTTTRPQAAGRRGQYRAQGRVARQGGFVPLLHDKAC